MNNILSLYVHIPFCVQKCNYCDFLSFPFNENIEQHYIEALMKEIELYGRSDNFRLASIYFGGGTPSLLSEESFSNLFSVLRKNYIFEHDIEITVEVNPGTLSSNKAKHLAKLGVNRISLGVQSMHDDELAMLGRIHKIDDVYNAVSFINDAGISNYSIDLMSGLPNQNQQKFFATLEMARALKPKHISLYGLKIEENTNWEKSYKQGELLLPDEDSTADIMSAAIDILTQHGYERYEISNYTLKGFESKHNKCYWLNNNYIGVGLGASSFFKGERFTNERNLKKYLLKLEVSEFPISDKERITPDIEQSETVFLGLRLIEGVEISRFQKRFGMDITEIFEKQIKKHCGLGLLEVLPTHIRLTRRGLDLANEVMQDFLIS